MTAVLLFTLTMFSSLLVLALGVFITVMREGDVVGGLVIGALGATMMVATVGMIVQEYAPRGRTRTLDALYNQHRKATAGWIPKRGARLSSVFPKRFPARRMTTGQSVFR